MNKDILNIDNHFLIDFDGVIMNTEKLVTSLMAMINEQDLNAFFEQLDWVRILANSNQINSGLEILKEVQYHLKKLSIITKIHSLNEAIEKTKFLRQAGIVIPIFYVPPHISKNEIFIPTPNDILVDDGIQNINRWEKASGVGILFAETEITENVKNKTKSPL